MTVEAFSGANYRRNSDRAGDRLPCVVCGKAVTTPRPWYVRVDLGNRIHALDAELGDDDFGCFPLGPECRRLHPELRELAGRV